VSMKSGKKTKGGDLVFAAVLIGTFAALFAAPLLFLFTHIG
jgi:hypothetical protein